jgi:putative SOS response-associated peptidase YedK
VDKETGEMVPHWTYTLITRDANNLMRQIHNDGENQWRMPLMLSFELSQKWVNEELSLEDYKAILDFEMPSRELDYRTVYTIRSPKMRPDDKAKNEFYEWAGLPALEYEEET